MSHEAATNLGGLIAIAAIAQFIYGLVLAISSDLRLKPWQCHALAGFMAVFGLLLIVPIVVAMGFVLIYENWPSKRQ